MTDFQNQDSRMRNLDPRFDPHLRDYDDRYASTDPTPPWGWIAGAIFVFLVLAAIVSWGGGERMAGTGIAPPASTTGMAPPANPRPATPTVPFTPPAPPAGQGNTQ